MGTVLEEAILLAVLDERHDIAREKLEKMLPFELERFQTACCWIDDACGRRLEALGHPPE